MSTSHTDQHPFKLRKPKGETQIDNYRATESLSNHEWQAKLLERKLLDDKNWNLGKLNATCHVVFGKAPVNEDIVKERREGIIAALSALGVNDTPQFAAYCTTKVDVKIPLTAYNEHIAPKIADKHKSKALQ